MPTRLTSLPAVRRWAVLFLVIAAISGMSLATGPLRGYGSGQSTSTTDAGLYRAVADRVRGGEDFYTASVDEQLNRGYPVRPAMTVREPTLAYFVAVVGGWRHAIIPLGLLALVAGLTVIKRLEEINPRRSFFLLSGFGALVAFGPYVGPIQATQHECWAGLLIVLSLALSNRTQAVGAVLTGVLACLFRELAAPFLLMMAVTAGVGRRVREVVLWVIGGVVFTTLYVVHLWEVGRHTVASDPTSPGWFAHGGLPHVLETIRGTTIASAGPDFLSVLVLVLGVLGWASIRSSFADRVVVWILMWVLITLLVGRPENITWGFMWTGPLVLGLVLVPGAVRDLVVGKPRRHGLADQKV